jgi:hypothetical protein
MIAFCGLDCGECPAYVATRQDDATKRQEVAKKWSSEEHPLKAEDINCDGCLTVDGRLIKFCLDCDVRSCGLEKNLENCALCDDYACVKLTKLWEMFESPNAKATLDGIRKKA